MFCRTLTGAWIETFSVKWEKNLVWSRTLTGAWIETTLKNPFNGVPKVAPSRVRGLKHFLLACYHQSLQSHPHGCVD